MRRSSVSLAEVVSRGVNVKSTTLNKPVLLTWAMLS